MRKKVAIFSIIFFLLDFLSKIILDNVLILGKSITVLEKFLYVTKAYNTGVSFSMLENQRILILIINIVILIFLYLYMQKFKVNKKNIVGFSLIYGGLFGNLVDRIFRGYVIDFIDFYVFNYNYPIFNFADTFICIGVCIIIYSIFLGEDNENSSNK